ncbi:MAG: hypothetical protein ABI551_26140 [Polyangiaceae bacterium]
MSDESTEYDALLTRLSSLVRRELGAEDVQLLRQGETAPDAVNVVTTSLTDGRLVVATFANAEHREAHQKRLDVLVRAFVESIAESTKHHSRPPPAISLREELRDLALRVNAVDALVLDARSPIVWGAGKTHIGTTAPDAPLSPNLVAVRASEPSIAAPMESTLDLTAAAEEGAEQARAIVLRMIDDVRALPEVDRARRGRAFRHVERRDDYGFMVHAFAGIYLLALVFDEPFDEMRAERSVNEALPRIERLVMVLPPLDPAPGPVTNVVSIRRPPRRG